MDNELKSLPSAEQVYLRFVNKTKRIVSIIWINFEGVPVQFKVLFPDTFLDVTSYVGHPWVFEDRDSRDKLVNNDQYVFYPPSWSEVFRRHFPDVENISPHRLIVLITLPVYSLRERCLQVVRDTINIKKYKPKKHSAMIRDLHLPSSVEEDLIKLILKKTIQYNKIKRRSVQQ